MRRYKHGFAIIEMLIAIAILSIVLISIISGVSAGIMAITGNKNLTRAMIIAKSKFNEFLIADKRGPDIDSQQIEEYPGFTFSRKAQKYQHEIFGPIPARRVSIIVQWKENDLNKKYTLSYVYPEQ
ncbi:MAG TPA: prepilin-type N-terminal cleavage/methylation domain-containing protein [Spirochaetota bacterium]|nr:prepilin-type N-terminal cleavage/methylation domain-containing protein [Spirochaetota bacterium]HPJ36812.1 prepilin-type N-terminal cleavage/methylation domain-containing protein [Spirochaetota bacterium]HPQ53830.1 prepilin-type N-terminal cleavage/methylation domain-containing protein [Spirochaetota bacterium]